MGDKNPGNDLLQKIESYNPDFDRKIVEKAIDFAVKYHGSQKRASGDAYYHHPISVATILADLKLDTDSIVTAILHDTVEDTEATVELITNEFGPKIAQIVNGVTKLDKINFRTESEKQAENFRKFLMAISEDIRVLLVKLADRLHNMRTLHFINKPEKRARIARETMDIYAPLAERIGIHKIKSELQDIAFKELYPNAYATVTSRLEYLRGLDENIIKRTIESMQSVLDKAGINAKVYGREKKPFSIWLKMQRKNIGFENVTDIIAFRIITESIEDCYSVLGVIHSHFRMVPGHFSDYISIPKANRYQSIHTIVLGEEQQRIEVQIRTKEMHAVAEYGVAAHWSYKQSHDYNIDGSQYAWVRQLLDILENAVDPDEILENTKLEMYHDHVFCFTPQGDLIVLPSGATPVDFAFLVHTAVGQTCAGSKVNGRVVPLRTKLKNGDQVEIIQAKKKTILPSWEGFVKTGKARSEIRRFIREKKQGEYVSLGKSIIAQVFLQNDAEFDESKIEPLIEKYHVDNVDEFYSDVGEGKISRIDVLQDIFPDSKIKKRKIGETPDNQKIALKGLTEGVSVLYSSCCHPLPGEKIVGIQSNTGVVHVHTIDCPELENFVDSPDKWMELKWDEEAIDDRYLSRLAIEVENKKGVLASLARICAEEDANIYNLRIGGRGQDFCKIDIDIEIHGINHLRKVERAFKESNLTLSIDRVKAKHKATK